MSKPLNTYILLNNLVKKFRKTKTDIFGKLVRNFIEYNEKFVNKNDKENYIPFKFDTWHKHLSEKSKHAKNRTKVGNVFEVICWLYFAIRNYEIYPVKLIPDHLAAKYEISIDDRNKGKGIDFLAIKNKKVYFIQCKFKGVKYMDKSLGPSQLKTFTKITNNTAQNIIAVLCSTDKTAELGTCEKPIKFMNIDFFNKLLTKEVIEKMYQHCEKLVGKK